MAPGTEGQPPNREDLPAGGSDPLSAASPPPVPVGDSRREAIVAAATRLFAEHGFTRTTTAEIARVAGVSKALLYHHYRAKEHLLFDILHDHIGYLLAQVQAADEAWEAATPRRRLQAMVDAVLQAYADADDKHVLLLHDLELLPAEDQNAIRTLQRAIVERFKGALAAAVPILLDHPDKLGPAAMALMGMLNWAYTWLKPGGPMSSRDYGAFVVGLTLDGLPTALTQEQDPP